MRIVGFNSQPPEGGWVEVVTNGKTQKLFQLTAARRRLAIISVGSYMYILFQLTAARRRLGFTVASMKYSSLFQLTAARRRLGSKLYEFQGVETFQLTAARRRLVFTLVRRVLR